MEYGININYFARTIGLQKAAELVAKAGFTALDFTAPIARDTWEADMKAALEIFKDWGLRVNQTHAPFNRYGKYNGIHETYLQRCAEATAAMGAKYLVVHGDEFDFDNLTFSSEAACEYNHRLFLPYVEFGQRNGFKVAFETVFEDSRSAKGLRRHTAQADELLALIKSFAEGSVACCWDSGHAHIAFRANAPEVIRQFGSLIECTHIHDNAGNDSHQLPMTGDIDWVATMAAFRDIGYQGVTSIEYSHGNIPPALTEDFLSLSCKAVRQLWQL